MDRDDDDIRLLRAELAASREAARTAEEAARRAEEASRLKDEFLGTLSHELRTPLSSILGWAKLLREGRCDPTSASKGLDIIERNAQAQQRIIEDILDVSRIVAGRLRVDTEPVDLAALASEVVESVRPTAESKEVEVALEPCAGRCRVAGDSVRLRQVLWNLLSNGVKFTPQGGRVSVHVEQRGDRVALRVSDTGKGIEPAFLPHVFERFRQADSSTTRDNGGLGLGLAIVRHLTEMHGGSASVDSAGLGRGASFTVTLPVRPFSAPVREPSSAGSAASPRPPARDQRLAQLSVLIVEDEVDSRELIELLLASEGATVRSAANALEALALLDEAAPDVLLSDIGMPGRDGYWLAREVRSRRPELPAIALTAFSAQDDIERAMAAGFVHHVGKPVDPEQLVRALTTCRRPSDPRRTSTAA